MYCINAFDEESGVEDLYPVPENFQYISVALWVIVYVGKVTVKVYIVHL